MKIYLQRNVWDAALARIRFLFDEFPTVIIGISGGKDSTVVFNLAMKVAEEKGRLPLKVLFVDQEAEWQATIDYVKTLMYDPRVEPYWLQCPVRIFNATSAEEEWLKCWHDGEEWMREREPISIKENTFGTDRFKEMFPAFIRTMYPNQKACYLAGVRCEESPTRMSGLTGGLTYRDITWGSKLNKDQYTFYPLYDWSYTDIWKAIHDNDWSYCKIYDYQYQHGVAVREMRVSNVHHEQAFKDLYYLQEIEVETWNRLVKRIRGINTAKHLQKDFEKVEELPFMFESWKEYRDHLLEGLISNPEHRESFRKIFAADERDYHPLVHESMMKAHVSFILANDYHGTKAAQWRRANQKYNLTAIAKVEKAHNDRLGQHKTMGTRVGKSGSADRGNQGDSAPDQP